MPFLQQGYHEDPQTMVRVLLMTVTLRQRQQQNERHGKDHLHNEFKWPTPLRWRRAKTRRKPGPAKRPSFCGKGVVVGGWLGVSGGGWGGGWVGWWVGCGNFGKCLPFNLHLCRLAQTSVTASRVLVRGCHPCGVSHFLRGQGPGAGGPVFFSL